MEVGRKQGILEVCRNLEWAVKCLKKYFLFKREKPADIYTMTGNLRMRIVVVDGSFSVCCGSHLYESGSLSLTVDLQNTACNW